MTRQAPRQTPRYPARDPESARRADLAKIHLARKDLGWDDSTYRGLLHDVCGVASSAELDAAGRARFLAHLAKCGWKARPGKPSRAMDDSDQSRMIRGLWLKLHALEYVNDPSEAALAAWIKRETKVEALQWLSGQQASQCTEKLKQWRGRDARQMQPLATKLAGLGRIPTANLADLARLWFGALSLTRPVACQLRQRLEEAGR